MRACKTPIRGVDLGRRMRTPISQSRRNLRYSSLDGIFATPWSLLSLPGSFLMAGMLNSLFEVGPLWFGIITAMPALANALQMLLIPFMARFMNVRDLTLGQCWLNTGDLCHLPNAHRHRTRRLHCLGVHSAGNQGTRNLSDQKQHPGGHAHPANSDGQPRAHLSEQRHPGRAPQEALNHARSGMGSSGVMNH